MIGPISSGKTVFLESVVAHQKNSPVICIYAFIGRPVAQCAIGGGDEGVKLYLEYVARDFKKAMVMTGMNRIREIDQKIIQK